MHRLGATPCLFFLASRQHPRSPPQTGRRQREMSDTKTGQGGGGGGGTFSNMAADNAGWNIWQSPSHTTTAKHPMCFFFFFVYIPLELFIGILPYLPNLISDSLEPPFHGDMILNSNYHIKLNHPPHINKQLCLSSAFMAGRSTVPPLPHRNSATVLLQSFGLQCCDGI